MSWYLSDGTNTLSDCSIFINKIIAAKNTIEKARGKSNYVGGWQ